MSCGYCYDKHTCLKVILKLIRRKVWITATAASARVMRRCERYVVSKLMAGTYADCYFYSLHPYSADIPWESGGIVVELSNPQTSTQRMVEHA